MDGSADHGRPGPGRLGWDVGARQAPSPDQSTCHHLITSCEDPDVFATLSDRLTATFKSLRGKGRLSEADVDVTIREIRRALLDADVALSVVRRFTATIRERALGAEVSQALNPAQQV